MFSILYMYYNLLLLLMIIPNEVHWKKYISLIFTVEVDVCGEVHRVVYNT